MKIGLLTYYGDLNCGTNLQAYATLLALRKAYPTDKVEVIPFHGFKSRILPYKSFSPISIWRDLLRIHKYNYFKKHYLGIKGKDQYIYNVDKALNYIAACQYDRIYIGADTLLELDRISFDGISAYWLKDVQAVKFLIAASSKNVTYEKLTPKQKHEMAVAVSQFSGIGVRDMATKALFQNFVDSTSIDYVPDPTFTLEIDYRYIENYLSKRRISIPKQSVFLHTYGDDFWADEIVQVLKRAGYTIVTPRPASWSDIVLNDMGPLEQLGLYRYLSFVITHRFHDSVFCLKSQIPFAVYVKSRSEFMTDKEDSKHISLLKDFELYPYGFLGCVDEEISSNDIIERIQKVRSLFDSNKIEELLEQKKGGYYEYLESTLSK